MAKPKSSSKKRSSVAPAKSKKADNDSDIEVVAEFGSDSENSDVSSSRGKSSRSSKKSSNKKRPADKRSSSRRESKVRSYKDDESNEDDDDEEQFVPVKKGKKAVELILEDSSNNAKKDEDESESEGEEDKPPSKRKEKPAKTKKESSKQTDGSPKKAPAKKKSGRPKKIDLEDVEEEEKAKKDEEDEEKEGKDKAEEESSKKKSGGRKGGKPKGKATKPAKKDEAESSEEDEDDGTEWEVERILDVHSNRGSKEFLIKWKGFPSSKSTWEPESNLGCPNLVEEFMSKLDKGNVSRTRRVSTIHSTQSSKSQALTINRVKDGRVTKRSSSRSRTPTIVSSSNPIVPLPVIDEIDGRQEVSSLTIPRQNGDLTLHKFMKESVHEKLRKIESRSNSVAKETDDDSSSSSVSNALKPSAPATTTTTTVNTRSKRRRFGRLITPAKWLAAGATSATGIYFLMNTPQSTFTIQNFTPYLESLLDNARVVFEKLKSNIHGA